MATKKKVKTPTHMMPDGSKMPGKTHAEYMNKNMMGVTGNAGSTDAMMGPTVVKIPKKKGKK